MKPLGKLHESIEAAGISIPDGLSRSRTGVVTIIGDAPHLTPAQRRQAEAIIAAFDWTDPKPVRPRAAIRSAVEALTATERNRLRDALAVEQLLDLAETDPDRVQSLAVRLNLTLPIREA